MPIGHENPTSFDIFADHLPVFRRQFP